MSEADTTNLTVIFLIALTVVAGFCVSSCSYKDGYKEGYIKACGDAHQGKLRYELKENLGGTRIWEEKKK